MKKIIKNIAIALFALAFSNQSNAQQPIPFNLNTMNPFLINPAYTGYNGCLNAFVNSHNQWTNLNNAPMANTLGIHGGISNNASLGGIVTMDNRSYVSYLTANLTYAYKIKIDQNQFLSLGLNAGIANNNLNTDKLQMQSPNDPLVQNFNSTRFDAGFGLLYGNKALKLGASMPHFFDQSGSFSSQYNIQASYDYKANEDWKLTPVVVARNYNQVGLLYDAHAMATWKDMFIGQLGYRTDQSIIAGIGVNWQNFIIAYAYQYNIGSNYNTFSSSGTQEVQLALRICKKHNASDHGKNNANGDKVNVVVNMIDDKYNTPVPGNIVIRKGSFIKYEGSGNESGLSNFYLEPGVYQMLVSAKGYVPVQEEIDITNNAKGSKYDVQLKPTKIEKGLVFKFKSINFETGSDKLTKSSYQILDKMAELFKDYPQMIVEVAGYTDNVGDDNNNLKLSEKRANSVAAYLKTKGVNAAQMKAVGYGEANPIADNNTEEGRLQNRRVMFTVLEF